MFQTDLLHGKRILITGGGTGLGKGMARAFSNLAPRFTSADAASRFCQKRKPNWTAWRPARFDLSPATFETWPTSCRN
jgi:NADP-dependent 3-hydroxy acid dehydrogenase YdfG